jgi:uncharacterized membrane protein YfcA
MTPDISAAAWAGMLGAALFAGVLRGFTGFGFALAAVPLASLALPPARVVPVVLLLQLAIGARDCVRERHLTDRGAVARLVLGCLAGTPVGIAALALLPGAEVRLALGAIVLVAVVATYRGPGRALRRRGWMAALAGVASGICNGLAAMSGPPAVLYFLAVEPDRVVTRSSLMVYFFFATAIALPGVVAAGLVDRTVGLLAAASLPVMWAGGRLGTWGFRRAGHRSYRVGAAFALLLAALAAIARGLAGLL